MKIRDLIRDGNPVTLQSDDLVGLAMQALDWSAAQHIPVLRKGKLVGLVGEDDLLAHQLRRGRDGRNDPVAKMMRKVPLSVEADVDVRTAAALLVEHGVSCLPVLTDGRVVGVVTRGEVLRCFRREAPAVDAVSAFLRPLTN